MALTDEELKRYARHIILQDIGYPGQKALCAAKVLVIGAGGLGSAVILYLAAAGVGTIGIADDDTVDLTNLQRQIMHTTADVGKPKIESASRAIAALNPHVKIQQYAGFVSSQNILALIDGYDFVVDCTDNFAAKFLINDACVMRRKPFSHAGVTEFHGQLMTVIPGVSPCYRCVFREPPPPGAVPSCSEAGVVGAAVGVIGSLQALEAIKYITGVGELLTGRLLTFDGLTMRFRNVSLPDRGDGCEVCADKPRMTALSDDGMSPCRTI